MLSSQPLNNQKAYSVKTVGVAQNNAMIQSVRYNLQATEEYRPQMWIKHAM